ncbi:unnamed protein product [Caenorhabditis auriculariae]|uniref:C-type lectin domain-containing protein n=1 Tax=Caenorhabditis auriculariae TaxID=2777116 RepID=A0A8S1I0K4_9PELO|nr:unnamed protein product [Caenorhabditis auriculariae]
MSCLRSPRARRYLVHYRARTMFSIAQPAVNQLYNSDIALIFSDPKSASKLTFPDAAKVLIQPNVSHHGDASQKTNQSFTWLPYYYFNGAYLGPDGKPPTFTNWAPGEPTLGEGFAAALHSSDGKWRTFLYSNQNNVICAFPNSQCSDTATTTTKPVIRTTSNPVIQPTPNPNYCLQLYQYDSNPCLDTSWFFYPRTCSCYKVLSQTHFSLAQSVCSNFRFNSNLASIHSDEEAVFVTDFAMSTNNNDNWQTHHDGQDDTIIGLYRADIYSQWYYTDTTPYQGFPWVAPHSATLDYYGTLITTRAPGYRGFGAFFNTGNNICRNAVCKYSLV